jgi:predicted DNA-binding WGR domain protein
MGYTTNFSGKFKITPPMSVDHANYLRAFSDSRRTKRISYLSQSSPDPLRNRVNLPLGVEGEFIVNETGWSYDRSNDVNTPPKTQPSLYCQWTVTNDNSFLEWNGAEKFYEYVPWLNYIIENFMKRWNYTLNGVVAWHGENEKDGGVISIKNNDVKVNQTLIKNNEDAPTYLPVRHFKFKDSKSDKFWEVSMNSKIVTINFGKNGTSGQTLNKPFATNSEAVEYANRSIREKVNKGYREFKVPLPVAPRVKKPPHFILAFVKSHENYIKNLTKMVKSELPSYLKSLIEDNLVSYKIQGYAPSFNDGDPCVFSVYEPTFKFSGLDDEDSSEDEDSDEHKYSFDFRDGSKERIIADEIEDLIEKLPHEFFTMAYGDSFEIIVKKNKIEINEDFYPE